MAVKMEGSSGLWQWGYSGFARKQLEEAEAVCGKKFVSEVKRKTRAAMKLAARGIHLDGAYVPDGVPEYLEEAELCLLNRGWSGAKDGAPAGVWDGVRQLVHFGKTLRPPLELWHFGDEVYEILGSYDHEVTAFIRLKRHIRRAEVLAFVKFPADLGL